MLPYSVLCSCYAFDLSFFNKDCWHNSVRSEFINSILPLVKDLEDSSDSELGLPTENSPSTPASDITNSELTLKEDMEVDDLTVQDPQPENGEKNQNKLVFKTGK